MVNLEIERKETKKLAVSAQTRKTITTILFIAWIELIILSVSMFLLIHQSLRLDESQSLWQTSRSLKQVYAVVAQDVHLPLYHTILHLWREFIGNTVQSARALSLVFFLISAPALFKLISETVSRRVAFFSTILFAISPFMNWYGNEIRMYSLLTLLTILSNLFFLRIRKDSHAGIWAAYFAVSLLGIYTHYFFTLNLLSQAVFFLLKRKKFPQSSFRNFATAAILLAASYLPWLYYVYQQGLASSTKPLLVNPSTIDLFNTYSQFIFGFQVNAVNTLLLALWPILVILGFLALKREIKMPLNVQYYLFSAVIPVVIVFVFSLIVRPFFLTRYLIIVLPSLFIFLGWLVFAYGGKVAKVLQVLIIGGMFLLLCYQAYSLSTPVKEDYADAVNFLNTNAGPADLIIVSAPFTIYPVDYYYQGSATVVTLPEWDRIQSIPAFSEENMESSVSKYKETYAKAWVLASYDQGYEEKIRLYFDTHFERTSAKEFSPKLNLYSYRFRY